MYCLIVFLYFLLLDFRFWLNLITQEFMLAKHLMGSGMMEFCGDLSEGNEKLSVRLNNPFYLNMFRIGGKQLGSVFLKSGAFGNRLEIRRNGCGLEALIELISGVENFTTLDISKSAVEADISFLANFNELVRVNLSGCKNLRGKR